MHLYANKEFARANYLCIITITQMETRYTVKNFRRFDNEGASVKISPITILTGTNSSGKSSIVKSLVLFERYLKLVIENFKKSNIFSPSQNTLNFSDNSLGLGRFDKVFNNASKQGDKMSFEYSVKSKLLGEEVFVEYSFLSNTKDKLDNGRLSDLIIYNYNRDVLLHLDYSDLRYPPIVKAESLISRKNNFLNFAIYSMICSCNDVSDTFSKMNSAQQEHLHDKVLKVKEQLLAIEQLPFTATYEQKCQYTSWFIENGIPANYIDPTDSGNKFPFTWKSYELVKNIAENQLFKDEICGMLDPESVMIETIEFSINNIFQSSYRSEKHNEALSMHLDALTFFKDEMEKRNDKIFDISTCFSFYIKNVFKEILIPEFTGELRYVGSSRIALKRLYSADDMSNELGHLFQQYLELEKNTEMYETLYLQHPGGFMKKWLKQLDIAYDIDIRNNQDGQGIEVRLYSNEDDKEGHLLADEGFGITHLISFLLNIEVAILSVSRYRYGKSNGEFLELLSQKNNFSRIPPPRPRTLTIEEPEAHLHPKLQSMLADMLFEAYQNYNIHFIVETHSEYLIRKSQVLVAQMGFQSNAEADEYSPFRTIYVPNDGKPYNLFYRKDGKFAESFGSGFFDEASRLMFEIL